MKTLSVIIPCSRPQFIQGLLESIHFSGSRNQLEVILCGSLPTDLTPSQYSFHLTLIDERRTHANIRRNLGLRVAQGTHIAFLDDDLYLSKSWVQTAFQLINNDHQAIFTGPEKPFSNHPTSQLVYDVSRSYFMEFSMSHVNFKNQNIHWSDIPFCNAIIPK